MNVRRGSGATALLASGLVWGVVILARADAPPAVSVSGGMQTSNTLQPLLFTWSSPVPVQGTGWKPGETVSLSLEGPLNTPGVTASSIALASVTADAQGAFSASPVIPYDQGLTGPQAMIPRPGLYSVRASGAASGVVTATSRINLCPATYIGGASAIDWSHERGTRAGVLPGPLAAYSPERSDPNWITVWDNRPIAIYGTVLASAAGGASQPSRISYEDDPITHYAHDTNFYLLPDPAYRWTVGTANYYSNGEDDSGVALGRIEVEWEALNGGGPDSYGKGQIGLPDWAIATTNDRMYVVGRWVLDAGHPEAGDRTELHPPRLIAVMRQRPAVSTASAANAQVDIYVSGHGGGANLYPSGMDALLDQGGRGGGRIRDALSAADQQTYYQAGPLLLPFTVFNLLVQALTGQSINSPISDKAGPSAFSWGGPAPESQPVNDMDYDFDVPLPPAPSPDASVTVEVITHPGHSTAVSEIVTYPASSGGPPATAHVHLPYRGADNGIYARTLKFGWNTPPQNHYRVTLNQVTVNSLPGKWQLWSDVAGQWTYLPALAPALLQTTLGQRVGLPGAQFDVYLGQRDSLRVLIQGYRAQCVDQLFAGLFGMASYSAGLQLLTKCGPVNNDDLGGALLELPALPSSQGSYTLKADAESQTGGGAFQADVTVEYVNPAPVLAECGGRGRLSPSISSGGVVGAGLGEPRVTRISPNGLISIFGQNFAPPGTDRQLTSTDVQNGQLSTNLACTCVAVNHRLVSLLYVSPSVINAQAGSGLGDGSNTVQVISNCGSTSEAASAPQTVEADRAAPEFFFFKLNLSGVNPVAAVNALSGALIGVPGLLPGASFTPVKPGDLVSLFATGLGLTDPPGPDGGLATQAAPTAFPVSVTLNGTPLAASDVLYAGAAPGYAGLYQVNIRVPENVPDGDLPVSLTTAGISTSPGAYISVHR